jgi:hypothetical protein
VPSDASEFESSSSPHTWIADGVERLWRRNDFWLNERQRVEIEDLVQELSNERGERVKMPSLRFRTLVHGGGMPARLIKASAEEEYDKFISFWTNVSLSNTEISLTLFIYSNDCSHFAGCCSKFD